VNGKKTRKKKVKRIKLTRKRKKRNKRKKSRNKKKRAWNLKSTMTDYRKEHCAPNADSNKLDFTCYTPESLVKIKQIWNARHPDAMITSNDPKKVWEDLKKKMGQTCDRESCWLKHKCIGDNVDKEVLDFTFAPDQPEEWVKKPNEWLSSIEITQVMKQYEHAYKCFEFLGPSPIDFDTHKLYGECVWEELCKFSLVDTIKRGKKKVGIIFNIDPHYKDGSHWVAMFINITKKKIYYFDSYGEKIEPKIKKFVKKVEEQSLKLGEKYEFSSNEIRHQYTQSECGMYSLYFIVKLLEGQTYNSLVNKKIPDKKMRYLRKKWFN
jgi:hypothetical protein